MALANGFPERMLRETTTLLDFYQSVSWEPRREDGEMLPPERLCGREERLLSFWERDRSAWWPYCERLEPLCVN